MKKAVYAGSFDPVTNGHLWIIGQGAKIFDELIVAVGENPQKGHEFSVADRIRMLRGCTKKYKNVTIDGFEGQFLVRYAKSKDAEFVIRGIRSSIDYEYERGIARINQELEPAILTICLIPPKELSEISSSMIKGLVKSRGWETVVKRYLPKEIHKEFIEHFSRQINTLQ
jgi:pantetheine-phosphate adenylyltransferase/8-oxo-dGTP diphosphatase